MDKPTIDLGLFPVLINADDFRPSKRFEKREIKRFKKWSSKVATFSLTLSMLTFLLYIEMFRGGQVDRLKRLAFR